jgi:hypothetical protein
MAINISIRRSKMNISEPQTISDKMKERCTVCGKEKKYYYVKGDHYDCKHNHSYVEGTSVVAECVPEWKKELIDKVMSTSVRNRDTERLVNRIESAGSMMDALRYVTGMAIGMLRETNHASTRVTASEALTMQHIKDAELILQMQSTRRPNILMDDDSLDQLRYQYMGIDLAETPEAERSSRRKAKRMYNPFAKMQDIVMDRTTGVDEMIEPTV